MKRFSKFIKESVELDEAVEVSHDRYTRSHGKKASGGHGTWMFTHKSTGDVDVNKDKEVHAARGNFSDAKKSAQQWAKRHGHSTVYVMEEVELDEERKSSSYQFTHKPGDAASEKKLADLKQSVKGTGKRVVLQGRLGKDNPNAHKYSKDAPSAKYVDGKRVNSDVSGKSGGHSHQRIQKADASHHDVYVYNRNESVELDELKKSTLGSYVNRAADDISHIQRDITSTGTQSPDYKNLSRMRRNRKGGIATAVKKLTREEAEELDEISKKTLGSYVKKASSDMASNAYNLGARDPLKKPGSWDKAFKRKAGIEKATDRLAKEEAEQIDELDKKTLGSYVKKSSGNMAGNAAVAAAQASSSMKKSSPETKRNITNRMKGIARATDKLTKEEVELDEVSDKKLDAYRQKAFADQPAGDDGSDKYRKRKFGRDLAFAKQTGRAKVRATKEEVELDELNKSTLGSYIKKSAAERGHAGVEAGAASSGSRDQKDAMSTMKKRLKGIKMATDKLTKEEVDINEASDLRVTKVYNKFPKKAVYAVHSPDRKYYKEFDTEADAKKHLETKK